MYIYTLYILYIYTVYTSIFFVGSKNTFDKMFFTFVQQVASATTYFLLAALQLPLQDLALSLTIKSQATFRPLMIPAIVAVASGLMCYGLGTPESPGNRSSRILS